MSKKKGKGGPKQQEPDMDEEYEALLAIAAANQKKIGELEKQAEDEKNILHAEAEQKDAIKFQNLPKTPSISFPEKNFPEVEVQDYVEAQLWRKTDHDLQEVERIEYLNSIIPDLREGAEVHRRVRMWAMENVIKPGVCLYDMCSQIEEAVRRLSNYQPVIRGLAFPCGCSLNNCAAHYTPLANDHRTLKPDDVMKVDFGVNINGHVIDSAWTVCFDPKFDDLLKASKEATNTGVKNAGIDVRLNELGEAIQEVIESFSLELNGKTYNCRPISNLSGHLMKPYTIHAGKSIPLTKGGSADKMEEGELYACETFASTGKGKVGGDENLVSHYMVFPNPHQPRTPAQRKLLKNLQDNFSTLAFCPRFLDHYGETRYQLNLKGLVECKAVNPYPALSDVKGSYVSQFEHTFILLPTHKEVLSRGPDY